MKLNGLPLPMAENLREGWCLNGRLESVCTNGSDIGRAGMMPFGKQVLNPTKKLSLMTKSYLLEKFILLTREIGHLPASSDLRLKVSNDPEFPTEKTYRRFGGKQQLVARLQSFAKDRADCSDIVALCETANGNANSEERADKLPTVDVGFVYLIKSGQFYKIGRSNAVGRRERELAIQLPEKSNTVHSIRTDDPIGIENYWHRRFESKRRNGEWFKLSAQDVNAFKRRKFM